MKRGKSKSKQWKIDNEIMDKTNSHREKMLDRNLKKLIEKFTENENKITKENKIRKPRKKFKPALDKGR